MDNLCKLGKDNKGCDVFSVILKSEVLQAQVLSFGATLKDLRFNGFENSLVLGYQSLEDYFYLIQISENLNNIGHLKYDWHISQL